MKGLLSFALAAVLFNTTGCAASFIEYNVAEGSEGCAPQVVADTKMGVSLHINEEGGCHALHQKAQ
ncbi:hypothetical protein [Vibrio mediterranei]|uniref:hypothetical protein n=1 Tax=Vibrio mediterranei TaxID=689 RepID=UPI0022843175|nr:hypothetical protein [Vibrio mediterranei]MCY9855824.1 hypothetical protein [Vibrio mediterranei]